VSSVFEFGGDVFERTTKVRCNEESIDLRHVDGDLCKNEPHDDGELLGIYRAGLVECRTPDRKSDLKRKCYIFLVLCNNTCLVLTDLKVFGVEHETCPWNFPFYCYFFGN